MDSDVPKKILLGEIKPPAKDIYIIMKKNYN